MPLYRPDVIAISASDATFQNTVRITGGANITVGTDASGISIVGGGGGGGIAADIGGNSTSAGAGYVTISSGTMLLAGGNNITLSQNGQNITISGAAAGGAQTAISGIIASNATYTSGTVQITGVGGGVTVSSNTGQRVDISVAAQTVQTQNMVAVTLGSAAGGATSGALALVSSGTLNLFAGNDITLSQNAQSVTISAQVGLDAVSIGGNSTSAGGGFINISDSPLLLAGGVNVTLSQNSNSVSILGPAAGAIEVGGIAASNTTYTSGTVVVSGVGGGVTVNSAAGQHVDISVAAQTVQVVQSAIAGSNTTYTSGAVVLTGSNMVTVKSSGAGQTIIFDATQSVQTQNLIDVTISGNTAGAGALVSSGTLTLAGGPNITLSQAGNAISISAAAAGAGADGTISGWYSPYPNLADLGRTATSSVSTPFVVPFYFEANATYSTAGVFLDCASTQSASTAALSMWFGIYTRETGASSTRLTLATSTSSGFTWTSSTGAISNWGGVSGVRRWEISGGSFNMTPGNYWAYINMAKGNAGTFQMIGSSAASAFAGIGLGSGTGGNYFPAAGVSNAGSAGVPPNSFAISNINTGAAANMWQPAFILGNNLP